MGAVRKVRSYKVASQRTRRSFLPRSFQVCPVLWSVCPRGCSRTAPACRACVNLVGRGLLLNVRLEADRCLPRNATMLEVETQASFGATKGVREYGGDVPG